MKLGILSSHPIQYQAPWFRELAKYCDLQVFFAHRPDAAQQGQGFGQAFTWDVDLLSGYQHQFLANTAKRPDVSHYAGCDTPEIGAIIQNEKFDAVIVTGWYLKSYWQAVWACRKAGIPVLVRGDSQLNTPRSKIKEWVKWLFFRQMLRRFDGFLTVGQRNEAYLRHYGVPRAKLFSAPHFIDNEWFAGRAKEEAVQTARLRKEWQTGHNDLVLAFAGKLIPKKRPLDVMIAVSRLPASVKAQLVYIGSGELEPSLRAEADKLSCNVHFAGFRNQSELPAYYAAADVLVLPSDGGETWGLVVNEAMACGTPALVSTACGCGPDLIVSGTTGFTFPLGDTEALANCLIKLADLQRGGHDWKPALVNKLRAYSVEACTRGTLAAIVSLRGGLPKKGVKRE